MVMAHFHLLLRSRIESIDHKDNLEPLILRHMYLQQKNFPKWHFPMTTSNYVISIIQIKTDQLDQSQATRAHWVPGS